MTILEYKQFLEETIERLNAMQQECDATKAELKDVKNELQSRKECPKKN